jgi:hypothetical protein
MIEEEEEISTEEEVDVWKEISKHSPDRDSKLKKETGLYYQSQYNDDVKSIDKKTCDSNTAADVVIFRPNLHFPKLTIYNDCNFLDGAKILVDRRLVFVVIAKYENQHWFHVKSGQIDGWIHISPQMIHRKSIEFPSSIVRYELWRGNNYFFCGGRCMTSYDIPLFR